MKFFIPEIPEEEAEEFYAGLAAACRSVVPPHGERVYSIRFTHDGVEYVATVGKRLDATKWRRTRAGHIDHTRAPQQYQSGSEVIAIFPGNPYYVWMKPGPTEWANPFMAGIPEGVTYFEE